MPKVTIASEPRPFSFDITNAALIVIDMQHDFCSKGGYVDHSGADVNMLRRPIGVIRSVLQEARRVGMTVIYTREGHRPGNSRATRFGTQQESPTIHLPRLAHSRQILSF
jgi:nicotinamidase-related amidase